MTLSFLEYRRRSKDGTIRKALTTELGQPGIVWFDFGRGRQFRQPFVLL